jgi:hypothetical protein
VNSIFIAPEKTPLPHKKKREGRPEKRKKNKDEGFQVQGFL